MINSICKSQRNDDKVSHVQYGNLEKKSKYIRYEANQTVCVL